MKPQLEKLYKEYEQHCNRVRQATTVKLNESPADKLKRKRKLEADYTLWFEYYFPMYAKVKCAAFHKRLATILVENDEVDLLAELYRSGAKSVHLDMGVPLFLYVKGLMRFMLLVGETDPKARKLISDVQAQFQYNQRFINDYGRKFKYGDWSDGDFTTVDGVKFTAISIGQNPRGLREEAERPDYIVVDDVDNRKRCNNDRLSREAYEWVWEDLKGTFDEGGKFRRFVVANNNFHKNTIINQLKVEFNRLNKEARAENRPIKHYVVTVKAVNNITDFVPAWPEKTSSEYWRNKFANTPYRSFMREYMHVHIQDGTIFQADQMQRCKMLQLRQYDGLIVYGDLSYKAQGDYKALLLVGRTGKQFHIIDGLVRKVSRTYAAKWLYDMHERRKLVNHVVRYEIEGLFAMDEFVNDFDEEGKQRGFYIPVVADKKPKTNKFERIESMSGFFERGDVWFSEEWMESTDGQNLIDQLLAFEKGSDANDDGPDCLQSAISKLNRADATTYKPETASSGGSRRRNRF